MVWITESDKRFWMPDILPEPADEYQQEQSEKFYLTGEGKERRHPGWTYADNTAYVDDEYLFQNEGWKVVIDEVPLEPVSNKNHQSRNTPDLWEEIDEKNVKVTYSISGFIPKTLPKLTEKYQENQQQKKYLIPEGNEVNHPGWFYRSNGALVDDEYLFQNQGWRLFIDDGGIDINEDDLKHKTKNEENLWDKTDPKVAKVTYTITDYTEEEIEQYREQKWQKLRDKRDFLLFRTDWIIVRAKEENLVVSSQISQYRQQLRDFPFTISDVLKFNIKDETLWPTKPTVYFEV